MLGVDIEHTDRIHLIPEEIQTIGFVIVVREKVYDTSSDSILTRSGYKIHSGKTEAVQIILQFLKRDSSPLYYPQHCRRQLFLTGNVLVKRILIAGYYQKVTIVRSFPVIGEGTYCSSTLYLGRHILHRPLDGPDIGSREKINIAVTYYIIQVIDTGSGLVLSLKHYQMDSALYSIRYRKSLG